MSTPVADAGVPRPRDAAVSVDSGPPARDSGVVADSGVVTPDAGPGGSSLGTPCSRANACPQGWVCGKQNIPANNTDNGVCTKRCSPATPGVCAVDYIEVGTARCGVATREVGGGNQPVIACGVACGPAFGENGMCPHGMVCRDLYSGTTDRPPSDGQNDYCTEPHP